MMSAFCLTDIVKHKIHNLIDFRVLKSYFYKQVKKNTIVLETEDKFLDKATPV